VRLHELCASDTDTASAQQTGDCNQRNGTQKSENDTLQIEGSQPQVTTENEGSTVAANERTDDPQKDVGNEAVTTAKELAGQPAHDQPTTIQVKMPMPIKLFLSAQNPAGGVVRGSSK
jgi:hypothetical protein